MVDDLTGPQIASFLDEHVREMLSITPPESKHALDLETLRGPGITFWSVRDGGSVVGCGALKRLDARHAEVKSMRTLVARQRSGIASMMLEHIIDEARRMGFTRRAWRPVRPSSSRPPGGCTRSSGSSTASRSPTTGPTR